MKKTVFCSIPMRDDLTMLHYSVDGNSAIEYDGEVVFPVCGVLARTMRPGDEVKVVLMLTEGDGNHNAENVERLKSELSGINAGIGASISYSEVASPFEETHGVLNALFMDLAKELSDGAEIIADITYGPKPLSVVVFTLMGFAEKNFGCDVKNIIYGKVDFVNRVPVNPVIYDLTSLYYLNSVASSFDFRTSADAMEALRLLLGD